MAIAIDSSHTFAIDFHGDTDLYRAFLVAGTTYIVDMEGAGTADNRNATLRDPWLELKDANGNTVLTNDNGGVGTSARFFFVPGVSGYYFLSAESHGQTGTGTYTLRLGAMPLEGSIQAGGSAAGSVDFTGDTDFWQVLLTAGTTYVFDLSGQTLADPCMELLDDSRSIIRTDDDSGIGLNASITFTPEVSGLYYIAARESGNDATGSYQLAISPLPSLSIPDTNVTESNSGTTEARFRVILSQPASRDVMVKYRTADDIAVSGSDYVGATGELVIPAGAIEATLAISVVGDTIFEPREAFAVLLSNPVNATLADPVGFAIIEDTDRPASIEFPTDRNFPWQWYLFSPAGANVLPVWKEYTGHGVRVAVFDQGIDTRHPDLDANLLSALGLDASIYAGNGLPQQSSDNHGTIVAGVIAAESNGDGIVGVAYGAQLVSIYSPLNEPVSVFGSYVANTYAYALQIHADIVNDSWGYAALFLGGANYAFIDDFGAPEFATAGQTLHELATNGRSGLGTVIVQSAGNSYGYGDDTNLHNFQNSRYIITVAASDYFANSADYSSPGVSILVTAPGGRSGGASGIISTDRIGAAGYTATDYGFFAGTSLSAPVVSGVVALMLEANPRLGYRDVQEILAYSAREIGPRDGTWHLNGADNWNGGGLHYDTGTRQFGFGLVDALAAVRLAETWGASHTTANLLELQSTRAPGVQIPDNNATGVSDSLVIDQHMRLERVDIEVDITHAFIGDLSIALDAPGGTRSWLLLRAGEGPYSAVGSSQKNVHFTFDTVADWGEDSAGQWRLTVLDDSPANTGRLDSWKLILTGKPASDDDVYVYTNEYATVSGLQPGRSVLFDDGGIDTLNAAAVTSASTINLAPGSTGSVNGRPLAISAFSMIENAYGGDGDDTLLGSDAANTLYGMRGADTLNGNGGNDALVGGAGNDTLNGGTGIDTAVFEGPRAAYTVSRTNGDIAVSRAGDGADKLTQVERLRFDDSSLAFDLDGAAGNTARLIGAAFGPHQLVNTGLVAAGLNLFDAGLSITQIAQAALDSQVFASIAHSRANADVVNQIYTSVVGSAPPPADRDYFVGLLDHGLSQAELLAFAAGIDLTAARIQLTGLAQTGIEYA